MNIIAVDDEQIALLGLMNSIRRARSGCEPQGFRKPADALDYARNNPVDVAFLDVEMRGMTGIECARELMVLHPRVNIVFTTGYSEYALDALELHVSGYVLKPVTPEKIRKELDGLRYIPGVDPASEAEPQSEGPRVLLRTLGPFEVIFEGQPLSFKYRRSKELLAYLVSGNGAWIPTVELMGVLFEEPEGKESYFKQLRKDLTDTLAKVGQEAVLGKRRGKLRVVRSAVDCDYFDWLDGKDVEGAASGEFLSQYDWAESARRSMG